MPVGLRSRVPAKMTSCMWTPRSSRADCSPSTQEMASEIFDLPQPLGPTMAVMPSPWKRRSVRSQNDLKPRIWSFFNLSKTHSLRGQAEPKRQRCGRPENLEERQAEPENPQKLTPTLLLWAMAVKMQTAICWGYSVENPVCCTVMLADRPIAVRNHLREAGECTRVVQF